VWIRTIPDIINAPIEPQVVRTFLCAGQNVAKVQGSLIGLQECNSMVLICMGRRSTKISMSAQNFTPLTVNILKVLGSGMLDIFAEIVASASDHDVHRCHIVVLLVITCCQAFAIE
jgi:hypothetical protein